MTQTTIHKDMSTTHKVAISAVARITIQTRTRNQKRMNEMYKIYLDIYHFLFGKWACGTCGEHFHTTDKLHEHWQEYGTTLNMSE